jgi:thiol-disulfide isomerase/thioredoxin
MKRVLLCALAFHTAAAGALAQSPPAEPPAPAARAKTVKRERAKLIPDEIFAAELKDLYDVSFTLGEYRGRVFVLNFWASWCGPCREEMPALEETSKAYAKADKPVTVIGVDASDVRSEAAKFLADVGVTYPTVYDQAGLRGGVAASWTVTGLPQTWFVARDGTRAGRIAGRLTADALRSRVDELLTGS